MALQTLLDQCRWSRFHCSTLHEQGRWNSDRPLACPPSPLARPSDSLASRSRSDRARRFLKQKKHTSDQHRYFAVSRGRHSWDADDGVDEIAYVHHDRRHGDSFSFFVLSYPDVTGGVLSREAVCQVELTCDAGDSKRKINQQMWSTQKRLKVWHHNRSQPMPNTSKMIGIGT